MDNFIRLDYDFDIDKLLSECYNVIDSVGLQYNQIGLTHSKVIKYRKKVNVWFDAVGSKSPRDEKNYVVFNEKLKGSYLEKVYNDIQKYYTVGRVRIMCLSNKTCYSLHADYEKRLHLPIQTNEKCLLLVDNKALHLPADGNAYLVDTTKQHTALNGNKGEFNRIHIIFNLIGDYDGPSKS